jgi:hypothetical protein
LKRRYARGEITKEEFENLKRDIESYRRLSMKTILRISLVMIFLTVAPLWAADDQSPRNPPISPGYGYGTGLKVPGGMMVPGSGYHGRGPGMMRYDGGTGHGMRGRGHMMGS